MKCRACGEVVAYRARAGKMQDGPNQSINQPTNQPAKLTYKQKEAKMEHVESTQKPVLKELLVAKASVELKPKV